MNKAELISILADRAGVTKKQAEDMVELFVETVTTTLQKGGEVTLAGFGTFSARTRKGRVGVNPQRPEEKIDIPSVVVPKFKAGKNLKDALKKPKMATPAPAPMSAPAPANNNEVGQAA